MDEFLDASEHALICGLFPVLVPVELQFLGLCFGKAAQLIAPLVAAGIEGKGHGRRASADDHLSSLSDNLQELATA